MEKKFELTAEEVRIIIPLLENKIEDEKMWLKASKEPEYIKEVRDCIDSHNNLLHRIKAFQNGNK